MYSKKNRKTFMYFSLFYNENVKKYVNNLEVIIF